MPALFQTKSKKTTLITILSLGVIFLWVSLFFSQSILPNASAEPPLYDATKPCRIGGFPLQVFEYPCGALGGDWPQSQDVSWTNFFINFIILLLPGFIVATVLNTKQWLTKVFRAIWITATILSFFGPIYIMLMFD